MKSTNKILISALAATVLSGGLFTGTAVASVLVALPASGTSTALAAEIHLAAIVCGSGGCAPVQTKATPRRKLHWLGHG